MFIRRIKKKANGKADTTLYLSKSYRNKNVKVRYRHLANISKLPPEMIKALEIALKNEKIDSISQLKIKQGKSVGAIEVIKQVSKRLGIMKALGNDLQGHLALYQIAGRIVVQGSRHYLAKEWRRNQAIEKVFNIKDFTVNDLYKNLEWLSENQEKIEEKIFRHRHKNEGLKEVFLYDVTSSYLEGQYNELAAYGYNRDKKQGKKQIVIGLLTDKEGYPVSVEVFKGNSSDNQTVSNQLKKLKSRFSLEKVIFVGDKGMIKSAEIEEIVGDSYKWYFLTSITKSQIRSLVKEDVLQIELFDEDLIEIEDLGIRYILRKNPFRAKEVKKQRLERIEKIKYFIEKLNTYLSRHKRAKSEVALRKAKEKISTYKLKQIVKCELQERNLVYEIDEIALEKAGELDGCYVIKTNVPAEELDKETAHKRYKDLSQVETAFRTIKTGLEHLRPIYVRKKVSTRGHVFVATLAYMIVKYIKDATSDLDLSIKYIINTLDKINYLEYYYNKEKIEILPDLTEDQKKILKKLKIKLK